MPSDQAPKPLPRRVFLLGASALALAGCSPMGLLPKPSAKDDSPRPELPAAGNWWIAFNDAQISRLISAGHARNLDLVQAIEAIRIAEATTGLTQASAMPQAVAIGAASRGDEQGSGHIATTTTGGLNVSWALDIFGANRNAKRAAEARLDANRASALATRLLIEGAIASAYVELRYNQASLSLTERSLTSRRRSLELTRTRLNLGEAAPLDVVQAEQLVAEGEGQLPQYEVGIDRAIARLASLTAQRSADLRKTLATRAAQPQPRYNSRTGVQAEMVRVRPDVQVQESLFEAATYEIGVARAAFWPSVSLSGSILPTNISGGGNVKPWSIGPSINLPIFTAGANTANLRGAEARAAQAHAAWQASVFSAIEEVESALAATSRDGRIVASAQKLVDTSQQAVGLAQTNFSLGEGTFMTVLDAERSSLSAQQGLAAAQMSRALNFITLSLASAGGTAPSA